MFITVTQQDTFSALALNIIHREREIAQYQINIDNYTHILDILPKGIIPENIVAYMGVPPESLPNDVSLEFILEVNNYQYRERISTLIRTESIEQAKSKHILEALKAQIPADQLDALVADALVKVNAQTPA